MSARKTRLVRIAMTANGRRHHVEVPPMKRLLDVLREDCGLTGAKEGCGEGECGACTVRMNGMPVNACLIPAVQADGAKLHTVEGLARGAALSALQHAFIEMGGAQCGICTPGMLISAQALIERSAGRIPGDRQVREALAGNLCRCTGYQKIVDAVRAAARAVAAPAPRQRARRMAPRRDAMGKRTEGSRRAIGGASRRGATGSAKPSTGKSKRAPARDSGRRTARRAKPKPPSPGRVMDRSRR